MKPRLKGRAFLVRYADDAVLGFECEADAKRVRAILPQRFGRYGLTLYPVKARLVDFRRPGNQNRPSGPGGSRGFTMLGLTHFWARSRKKRWVIKRKSAAKRLTRAVRQIWQWC